MGLGLGLGIGLGIGLEFAQARRVSIWRRIAMVAIAVRWLTPLRSAVRWLPPQAQMPLGTGGASCLRAASELREERLVIG